MQTQGRQEIVLERKYVVCSACGEAFPSNEELQLLLGSLTPGLQEVLVRLGAWMPFAQAQQLLVDFVRLNSFSEATSRQHTEVTGAAPTWPTRSRQQRD